MPSHTYVNLTLGASGTTYTAPADGWFMVDGVTVGNSDAYVTIQNYNACGLQTYGFVKANWRASSLYIPAKKNDIIDIAGYSGITNAKLKFIYAVGSAPA